MRFGRLVVIKQAEDYINPSGKHYSQWLCRCDCGNETVVVGSKLSFGHTQSCGCLMKETSSVLHKKYNTYDLTGEYGIGYASNGKEFYFDLEDYDKIKVYCWYVGNDGYVRCSNSNILMHRLIMDCPDELVIDHIHGENTRNNNRKSNLRLATVSENAMNAKLRSDNTSGYTGISWSKNYNKWWVRITTKKDEDIDLGYFNKDDLDKAIQARLDGEKKYFGEYSYTHSQKIPID